MIFRQASGPAPEPSPGGGVLLSRQRMAEWLLQGHPALLPTDTVPALAAVPQAAAQIWGRKQRPQHKPLILMGADLDQLRQALAAHWRQEWLEKARRCWPGAFTLVLPITGSFTEFLHPAGQSLGLRVPDCGMTQALLRLTGPLATTSANLSGHQPATTAAAVSRSFPDLPLLGPLPWPGSSGQASQVLEWVGDARDWRILRPGAPPPDPPPAA